MSLARKILTTLRNDGTDMMGTQILALHLADNAIVSGSLLTVESTHFAVVKARGAVLNTYDTGQHVLTTPDTPIIGSFVQGFFGGQSPWQYEVIYVNRCKLLVHNNGVATSREMAEVTYTVDYYIHVDTKDDAVQLITHLPFNGHQIDVAEIAQYAGPAIEQAINQVIQVTPLERINEEITKLLETVKAHLAEFLAVYGIKLNDLKVLVLPRDERMRELIALQAIGLSAKEAVQYYLALKMAERGLISAPNAAIGAAFSIGGQVMSTMAAPLPPPARG